MKDREIAQIEELVNEQVQANVEVARMEMDLDEALRMGALALFGEKYGDRVRVVKIGDFSTELCGGTHLERTGELGLVKVTTEGAVASGVRRIEAVAGSAALETVARKEAALREAAEILKIAPLEVPSGSPSCSRSSGCSRSSWRRSRSSWRAPARRSWSERRGRSTASPWSRGGSTASTPTASARSPTRCATVSAPASSASGASSTAR